MKLHFLYGTESGTAELLAEDLEAAVSADHETQVSSMEDLSPADLNKDDFYIMVCSTYGSGDLPASAISFYETLQNDKPDLSGVTFSIFGLGDQTYAETFNFGSQKLMTELKALGATQVGDRGLFDASDAAMPEDVGVPWVEGIVKEIMAVA